MPAQIPLTFRLFKRPKHALVAMTVAILFYQFSNFLRPGYGDLAPIFKGEIWMYLKDLFLFYFGFEWISIGLFWILSLLWIKIVRLKSIRPRWSAFFEANAKYFPLLFVSILIFGPITNGVRYIVLNWDHLSMAEYYPEYFMQIRMYTRYLTPVMFIGILYFNYNLFLDYSDWQKEKYKNLASKQGHEPIETYNHQGVQMIDPNKIKWVKVDQKQYLVHTESEILKCKINLNDLEDLLEDHGFYRANRSVLINLKFVKNYTYWEHDKYIVRIDEEEFVMQRSKLKTFKEKLQISKAIN
ncbi:MAG: LytTR family transcriptional regulator DNA-binding domain-containing protein [Leadbetterella sp.]